MVALDDPAGLIYLYFDSLACGNQQSCFRNGALHRDPDTIGRDRLNFDVTSLHVTVMGRLRRGTTCDQRNRVTKDIYS